MNFSGQYISSISRKIIAFSIVVSIVLGKILFIDPGMVMMFAIMIAFISTAYGEEIVLLFASENLKLKIQIGDIGISYLKFAIHIFKSNGEITEAELQKVEKYMSSEFNKQIGQSAKLFVQKHMYKHYSIKSICSKLGNLKHTHKLQLVYQLFALAFIDKDLHKNEEQIILKISNGLHIGPIHFKKIRAMYLKSKKSQHKSTSGTYSSSQKNYKILKNFFGGTSFAYLELGLSSNATDDELKMRFRDLAKRYHPDKWVNAKKSDQKKAKEKFQKINNAYEIINKSRNIK